MQPEVERLARTIEKHIPSSGRLVPDEPAFVWSPRDTRLQGSVTDAGQGCKTSSQSTIEGTPRIEAKADPDTTRWSHLHARHILIADAKGEAWFGASADVEHLERLVRAVRDVQNSLNALSISGRSGIRSAMFLAENYGSTEIGNSFDDAPRILGILGAAAEETLVRHRRLTPSRKGRNWRAAAVAEVCRIVWAQEKWAAAGEEERRGYRTYVNKKCGGETSFAGWQAFIRDHVPHSEKSDAPGPFGRFLEDVMLALGITGREGASVSASSALRARLQARAQHPRNLPDDVDDS